MISSDPIRIYGLAHAAADYRRRCADYDGAYVEHVDGVLEGRHATMDMLAELLAGIDGALERVMLVDARSNADLALVLGLALDHLDVPADSLARRLIEKVQQALIHRG